MRTLVTRLKDIGHTILVGMGLRALSLRDTGSCDDAVTWDNDPSYDYDAGVVIDHDAPIEGAVDIMGDNALHAYCWRNVKALDPIKVSAASMMLYDKFVEDGALKELIERITENRTGWLMGRPNVPCWMCKGTGLDVEDETCRLCKGSKVTHEWPLHHGWGTAVRNLLREKGYGEAYFGIDNLDDVYSVLVELACGFQGPGCKGCPDCV